MKAKAKVISVDVSGVKTKTGRITSDAKLGLFAAEEAERLMRKYVPYRSGALADSSVLKPWAVIYRAPYAPYVYEGRNMTFSGQVHPNARSHWDEPLRNDPSPLAAKITQRIEAM